MVLVGEGELCELSVQPAGSGSHECVLTGKLGESKLLEQGLDVVCQVFGLGNLGVQKTDCVQQGFLHSEIALLLLEVAYEHLEEPLEVVRDLLFARGLN